MSSPPSVRAAIVVSLSIIAVDVANAKGTFRLQGACRMYQRPTSWRPIFRHAISSAAAEGGGLAIPKRSVAVARQTSDKMGEWLAEQFTLVGLTFQNWMIIAGTIIVIAALISRMENG